MGAVHGACHRWPKPGAGTQGPPAGCRSIGSDVGWDAARGAGRRRAGGRPEASGCMSSRGRRGGAVCRSVPTMTPEQLDRIRDLIDELRDLRLGTDKDVYRNISGAISNLRHILRMHGKDSEPG